MAVAETATSVVAIELSSGDTNTIFIVVHVVENINDTNAIGRVVSIVKNLKNPARLKIPLLMEAPNAFIFICSCDLFTLIRSGNSIGTMSIGCGVWICSGAPSS